MRGERISILTSIISISTIIILVHSNLLWPWVNVLLASSIIAIFGMSFSATRAWPLLLSLILLCVSSRLILMSFPESFIGFDPHIYAYQTGRFLESGGDLDVAFGYYQSFPLYISFLAMLKQATDTSFRQIYYVVPVLTGILYPLVAFQLAKKYASDTIIASVGAASIATVGAVNLRFSLTPVAQTLAMLFFLPLLLIIRKTYLRYRERWEYSVLIVGGVFILIYIHKLVILFLLAAIGIFALYSRFATGWDFGLRYFEIGVIALVSLWTFQSNTIIYALLRVSSIFQGKNSESLISPPGSEIIATPIDAIHSTVIHNINWIVLVPLVGIFALYGFYRRTPDRIFVAGLTLFSVGMTGIAYLSGIFNQFRVVWVLEIVGAVVLFPVEKARPHQIRVLAIVIAVVVIVIAQVATVGYVPGDSRDSDSYLSTGENQAKLFAAEYADKPVFTDSEYARLGGGPSSFDEQFLYRDRGAFQSADHILLNGYWSRFGDGSTVLIRTDERVFNYLNVGGIWKPVESLKDGLNRECSNVYSNEDGRIYKCYTGGKQ